MKTLVNFNSLGDISPKHLVIIIKDLEKLVLQEPTSKVKRQLIKSKCKKIDVRKIQVLYGFTESYGWFYRVTDFYFSRNRGKKEKLIILGSSGYSPVSLSRRNLTQSPY